MHSTSEIYAVCDLCGSDCPERLFYVRELPDGRFGGIVRCGRCGLVYRNIREKMDAEKESYSRRVYENVSYDWIQGRKNAFVHHIEEMALFRLNNRVLDIGAGHGFFLAACAEKGWECHGVEISKECVGFARRNFDLDMKDVDLRDACFEDGWFDVVTFWNVLDQVPDPLGILRESLRILRPGGMLMVRVPNAHFHVPVRSAVIFARRWVRYLGIMDPSVFHLIALDRTSLTTFLLKAGFERPRVRNAKLSWTTEHNESVNLAKKIACALATGFAASVKFLTAGRLLLSPSIMAMAIRPDASSFSGS